MMDPNERQSILQPANVVSYVEKKRLGLQPGGGGAAYNVTKSLIKEFFLRGGKLFGELCVPLKKPLLGPWLFFFHSSNEIYNTHRTNVLRILAFLSRSFGQKSALVLPSNSGDCPFFSSLWVVLPGKEVDRWCIAHSTSFLRKCKLVSKPSIYHRFDGILFASSKFGQRRLVQELAGGFKPLRNDEIL